MSDTTAAVCPVLCYKGVSVYETVGVWVGSPHIVATRSNCRFDDADAFDYRELSSTMIGVDSKYELLFPGDARKQILAFNIDTKGIKSNGLSRCDRRNLAERRREADRREKARRNAIRRGEARKNRGLLTVISQRLGRLVRSL